MDTETADLISTAYLRHVNEGQGFSDLSAKALLFGALVRLAAPTLDSYQSDLFHDALWVNDYVSGRLSVFYFSYDGGGTTIGTDGSPSRANRYRMVAHVDQRDSARVTVERLVSSRPERMRAREGDVVRLELGASEVIMHMRMTGECRWVRVLPGMAQILNDQGMPACPPVTHGEAGFWRDGADFRFEPAPDYPTD